MLAVVANDGAFGVEERPDPVPGDTEVLVAVRAAGVNGADILQRAGRYPAPPGAPDDICGLELAGEVVATGRQVSRWAIGDRVMAVVGGGGQASLAVVDESHALEVPETVSWEQAGGFPEVFSTAHDALMGRACLRAGEQVLITGAAGGVGTAAVQLAAAAGARVVASVRDRSRWEEVASLGAEQVVAPDAIGDHGPYDVVLELVGAPSLPDALRALATEGRAVVIGVGAGARIELDLRAVMARRAVLTGATLRARTRVEKAVVAQQVGATVVPLLAAGRLRVPVCSTFPLARAPEAYDRFVAGSKLGKVVILT